jgi:hypothetical protein
VKIVRRADCVDVELTGDQTHITGWRKRVSESCKLANGISI